MGLKAKRELNSELNLTSFIDLLSTLVCFLLISAVWVQVASMDIKQSNGTESAAPQQSAALDVILGQPGNATMILKMGAKVVQRIGVSERSIQDMVKAMQKTVIGMKNLPAMKGSVIESVLVAPNPKVMHGELISVLDGFRLNGITNIGIKPNAGEK